MIRTAQQLKGKIRNLSMGDSAKAQMLMRTYATERFLERLSLSPYRENLILKGGTLVAALVGLEARSTMDVDTTIKSLPLTKEDIRAVVDEICAISLDDGMAFEIEKVETIMDDDEYPGIRVYLQATLERIRIPMKLDFSTDEAITPSELRFEYRLMFENRSVAIMAYNAETLIAEKLETVVARGVANTRMRDFYDLFVLEKTKSVPIDEAVLRQAFVNTCGKRGTSVAGDRIDVIVREIRSSREMSSLWQAYGARFSYASCLSWPAVLDVIEWFFGKVKVCS